MRWSLSLGSIGGTEIRIHVTFLLFLVWLAAIYYRAGGPEAAWQGTIFIALVFLCVLLHELGHVFAARRYGVKTRDVTLWPFGGIASMERMPEKPSQELIVALAGPAVNVVIAAVLLLWLGTNLDPQNLTAIENPTVSLAAKLAGANIILVLFNMIPAFPMDGGRVLRALLAMHWAMRAPLSLPPVSARASRWFLAFSASSTIRCWSLSRFLFSSRPPAKRPRRSFAPWRKGRLCRMP